MFGQGEAKYDCIVERSDILIIKERYTMSQLIKVPLETVLDTTEPTKQSKKELIASLKEKGLSDIMIATMIHETGYLIDD